MELIDVNTERSPDPHFYPEEKFEICRCQPVIDYHFLGKWGQYFKERFDTQSKDLPASAYERDGF